jgi:hypothetical protein
MKRLLLGVCLIVVLVFGGCASNKVAIVFDPEIPEDQMSFLYVPNYVRVTQFAGRTVDWTAPLLSLGSVLIGVPSGEFTFVIDTIQPSSGTNLGIPNVSNKSYTKNFEARKVYQLLSRGGQIVIIDL